MKPLIPAKTSPTTRVFVLGMGDVVVAHGVYQGMPCLVLSPAKEKGQTHASAAHEQNVDGSFDDAVILAFANPEAVETHKARIERAVNVWASDVCAKLQERMQ